MHHPFEHITSVFRGRFVAPPVRLYEKLEKCKAYVFDWDGVFNDGFKNDNGSSPYSEIDSMGTNLLRYNHFLRTGNNPVFAIISGEKNTAAFTLSQRENFHSVYFRIKHKADALEHLCKQYDLKQEEIAFVYDDVLDLSAARLAGLRVLVPHTANPMLTEFCTQNGLVDYITYCNGNQHAVREAAEMLMGISGHYNDTIRNRMDFSGSYQEYLQKRNQVSTSFFTIDNNNHIQPATV